MPHENCTLAGHTTFFLDNDLKTIFRVFLVSILYCCYSQYVYLVYSYCRSPTSRGIKGFVKQIQMRDGYRLTKSLAMER